MKCHPSARHGNGSEKVSEQHTATTQEMQGTEMRTEMPPPTSMSSQRSMLDGSTQMTEMGTKTDSVYP